MELVSTPKVIFSETEKPKSTCNFQTINSFVMSHDLMRGQIEIHAYEILLIRSFVIAELNYN